MNMADMLLQMVIQNTWQPSQVTRPGQSSGTQNEQGTSFQDLLDQRREDLTQEGTTPDNAVDKGENVDNTQTDAKPGQDEQGSELEAMAAAAMPMLLNQVIPVQQVDMQVTGVLENTAVQAVEAQEMMPMGQTQGVLPEMQGETVQAPIQQMAAQTVQPQQAQVTTQPTVQDTAQAEQVLADQPQQVATVSPEQPQSQSQEELSQDLTQSANTQSAGDETKDVTVESFQTPLFREVEATPVRVGDAETVDMTAPAQEVEKSLSDILKGALDQGDQHVEIKLNPANLGTVTAEFTRTPEGVLHVVLHAETEQTAKLLSDHAANLGAILQDGNRGEVRVQVAQPQENQSAWQHPDQDGGQQQQHSQQQQRNTPRQEAETFLHQLRLGLVEMETEAV